MQQIKTVVYKDLELDDNGVNYWLSQGWEVYDLATSITLNEESKAGNGMTVIRIFTLVRDMPDATKAQDAPRKFKVGDCVTIDGTRRCIVAIEGDTALIDFRVYQGDQTEDDYREYPIDQLTPAD